MMTDDELMPKNEAEPEAPATPETAEPVVAPVEAVAPAEAPAEPQPVETVPEPVAPAAPVATVAPEPEVSMDDSMLFEAAMAELEAGIEPGEKFKRLSRGDRVEATVIQVENDRVFVDLGTKSEGVVPIGELTEENIESAKGHVQVGDKIQVIVLRPESGDGNTVVSKKRADFEDTWNKIIAKYEAGEMISAQVIDRVKGGLVVDIGVRGFVPATHVGSGRLRNIDKYVGETLQLKIIEIDRDRKKVVLSNREAEEKARASAKEELFTKVKPGDVLEGTVRRLADYGAFVDLGGVDGLLHVSEMSWMRINHPREVLKEGQEIKVMVLRLDPANGKISLGHRQVLPDPWSIIRQNYSVGQKLTCKISRIVVSGAFVRLPEGAEAFMPISEMSSRRIKHPSEVIEEGAEVEVQVLDLRPDERRMVLSLRALGAEPERTGGGDSDDPFDRRGKGGKKGGKKGGRGRDDDDFDEFVGSRRGFATGGATIGERLGMLKGLLRPGDDAEETEEAPAEAPAESEEKTEE
ncbi:MAG TPA: 30S ribosomal protein S1 [Fimbriimonadaceae bacterium]|nr:30S ribosomal protein S1 [Fimbriimonadaceae bacterium]